MNFWSSKKPSLVMARACVLIFQAFQLFSSSVQFCGLSRLPCPCRPESHKRNTCFCILSNSSISVLLAGCTVFLLLCATALQSGERAGSSSAEKQ